jgi:hypothetical protein
MERVVSAIIAAGSKKFINETWDAGKKWLNRYGEDHSPRAQEAAMQNTIDFLKELAYKIEALENSQRVSSKYISEVQNHPEFAFFLRKAMITASLTDNNEKHKALAKLVTERLAAPADSLVSMVSKLACDAISFMSLKHMQTLAVITILNNIRPSTPLLIPDLSYTQYFFPWIRLRLDPFIDLDIRYIDVSHLESLACVKRNDLVQRELDEILSEGDLKFQIKEIDDLQFKKKLERLWKSINNVTPTTIGQMIGVITADSISLDNTSFQHWG